MDKNHHWAVVAISPSSGKNGGNSTVSALYATYTKARNAIPFEKLCPYNELGTKYYICQVKEEHVIKLEQTPFVPRDEGNYTDEEREAMEKYYTLHATEVRDEEPF